MAGVFALQSLVSIIEEWYLEKGTREGQGGGGSCAAKEGWAKDVEDKKKKSVMFHFDESLLYVWNCI